MSEKNRDPLVATWGDKVEFFRKGEGWRNCWPRDYKPHKLRGGEATDKDVGDRENGQKGS